MELLDALQRELAEIRIEQQKMRELMRSIDGNQAAIARAGGNQSLQLASALPAIEESIGQIHGGLLAMNGGISRIEKALVEFAKTHEAAAAAKLKAEEDAKQKALEEAAARAAAANEAAQKAASLSAQASAKANEAAGGAPTGVMFDDKHVTARFPRAAVDGLFAKAWPWFIALVSGGGIGAALYKAITGGHQ